MQTQPRPRQINHSSALASAEDDFLEQVHMFGPVVHREWVKDCLDAEVVARMTLDFTNGLDKLLNGMSYAAKPKCERPDLRSMLLELISDQMQYEAGAVVKAQFLKMESGK